MIQKVHHSVTDGVGGDEDGDDAVRPRARRRGDPGRRPTRPSRAPLARGSSRCEASDHERRRQLGIARRSVGSATRAARRPAARHRASIGELAASAGRMLAPGDRRRISPIMTGRSLSARFDTISVPLDELKAAAKTAGGKLNDAFVAAVVRRPAPLPRAPRHAGRRSCA